jgi:hypothetical protein
MLRIEIYPVMDGYEMWVVGFCRQHEGLHTTHSGERVAAYVDRERIDKHGLEAVVGNELAVLLSEFPEVVQYARC